MGAQFGRPTAEGQLPPPGLPLRHLLTVQDETDASGRLLLEDSAPKRARRAARDAGIPMKDVRCPYEDTPSRYRGSMNISAYESLRQDVADILNGYAWLAWHYYDLHPGRRSTPLGLFELSHLGITLPLVLFHRADDPIPRYGKLPTYVASMFKASRGIFSASVDLVNKHGPTDAITLDELMEFVEAEGHLARRTTGRVCAAPTRLIQRTLGVLLAGEGGDARRSGLGQLLSFPWLWRFYVVQEAFSSGLSEYRFVLEQLRAETGIRDPMALAPMRVSVRGRTGSFGQLSEALVLRANDAQVELNRLLGRADDPRPLSLDDVLRML